MAKYIVALALLGCAMAEPPVGYSYSAPSSSISLGSLSSGGHYHSVPVGHSESEGYYVDPHLLHKIKNILLSEEIKNQEFSGHGHGHGHGHGLSSQYGAPAPVYGVPSQKVVGIELDHVQQAIQVAQYHQAEEVYAGGHGGYYSGGNGGYSSGGHGGYSSGGHGGFSSGGHGGFSSGGHGGFSSGGHGGSSHYTTIGIPSGSYGVPSESYGHPH